jgi:hypothetical protein
MPPKRKREPKGLGRGEQLKRTKLAGVDFCNWNWIGAEVVDTSQITPEHRLAACGLESWRPICPNKYAPKLRNSKSKAPKSSVPLDNSEDVVIEDEPPHLCDKTTCRKNPNCLNYLGQEKWENSGMYLVLLASFSYHKLIYMLTFCRCRPTSVCQSSWFK